MATTDARLWFQLVDSSSNQQHPNYRNTSNNASMEGNNTCGCLRRWHHYNVELGFPLMISWTVGTTIMPS